MRNQWSSSSLWRQRALLLLDNRTLDIGDIAARLGYSELASFTRAFRKWTGMTPLAVPQPYGGSRPRGPRPTRWP